MAGHNPRIRVLLTVPQLSSTASPYREIMALARYLPQEHFQLTICSLRMNGFAETAPVLEQLGCRVLVARFRPRGRKWAHLRAAWKDYRLIAQYGPFDIQHSLDFTSSPLEAVFARLHRQPFIFTQRNLGQAGSPAGIWLKIRLANKIIAISDVTLQLLISLGAGPGKVTKIPLGMEPYIGNLEGYAPETGGRYLLSVGHVQRLKHQHDAIITLARLIPEIPDLSLLIAGEIYDPDYYQDLIKLAGDLGIDHRVHFLGVRDDIPVLMKGASALLLCSESEAFSWVVLEAMSVGLPVVSSDCGGPGEIITHGQTGSLVPVGDIDGYVHALQQIILEPGKGTFLSNNAYELISTHYSATAMAARHAEMYQSLIAKTSGTI
ncbi:MAG: glycosyltransferase family 4 protein [Desulfobaccales bacterium]